MNFRDIFGKEGTAIIG